VNVISASYGNDSVAMIQLARELGLQDVHVVFVDTHWSAPGWLDRVAELEGWVRSLGFSVGHIKSPMTFEELMVMKKGFPYNGKQWCSGILKGIPFLDWIEQADPECKALVLIGKRREESVKRQDTPEFIEASEYHGGRRVWHPLFEHTNAQRDEILRRAGIKPLPHRSKECNPCINANKDDLRELTEWEIVRLEGLESRTGQTMFRPKKHGNAIGIRQVVDWANSRRGKYNPKQESMFNECSSGYCGF